MSENQKITPEQLTALKTLQEQWNQYTKAYGELSYQKRLLEAELKNVEDAFDELDAKRLEISNQIQGAFGTTGHVDLTTGEFVPD
jgi:chaperonin cofactor prefoldin